MLCYYDRSWIKLNLFFGWILGYLNGCISEIVNCGTKWCAGARGPNKELSYPRCWWGQVIKQLFSLMEFEENCFEIIDCEKQQCALTLSSFTNQISFQFG